MGWKAFQLKSQDVLLLLKLLSLERQNVRGIDIAQQIGLSQGEVSNALRRLRIAQLLHSDGREPLRQNALEFLEYGVRYAFPAILGPNSRGLPTAHSAPPLSKKIISSDQEMIVWSWEEGKVRGQSVTPIYSTAPFAASRDEQLYELLALVDALRIGRARERQLASQELKERISRR